MPLPQEEWDQIFGEEMPLMWVAFGRWWKRKEARNLTP